jgi:hypothetical protein
VKVDRGGLKTVAFHISLDYSQIHPGIEHVDGIEASLPKRCIIQYPQRVSRS